jgi:hypothetical protein
VFQPKKTSSSWGTPIPDGWVSPYLNYIIGWFILNIGWFILNIPIIGWFIMNISN